MRGAGGCSLKVDAKALGELLTTGFGAYQSIDSFADVAHVGLPRPSRSIITSIDCIFDPGLSAREFGRIGVVHAVSDIYAALGTPVSASLCVGVPTAWLESGAATEMLKGAVGAAEVLRLQTAGGHTVYSDPAFLVVSVVGVDSRSMEMDPEAEYDLLLSKPLGVGVYIAALRHGEVSATARQELEGWMQTSNEAASVSLRDLLSVDPSAVGCVTDVTGFGLLLSLRSMLPDGWSVEVDWTTVPLLDEASAFVHAGFSTGLGDRSLLMALDDPQFDLGCLDVAETVLANDPQTSGGLVAAVRSDLMSTVGDLAVGWSKIGVCRPLDSTTARAVVSLVC